MAAPVAAGDLAQIPDRNGDGRGGSGGAVARLAGGRVLGCRLRREHRPRPRRGGDPAGRAHDRGDFDLMLEIININWRPAVEILILAVGIYYVFSFVRRTRGFAIMTRFLLVLLTLALASRLFDFKVLNWLLGTFSAIFAVAVLVIFQPELRRMLAQAGNLPLFHSLHGHRPNIEGI